MVSFPILCRCERRVSAVRNEIGLAIVRSPAQLPVGRQGCLARLSGTRRFMRGENMTIIIFRKLSAFFLHTSAPASRAGRQAVSPPFCLNRTTAPPESFHFSIYSRHNGKASVLEEIK